MPRARAPSRAELLTFANHTIPDVIAPGLTVLFCGINPSLYSAYTGHHFARPGNRFWPALYGGGFSDTLLRPDQGSALLARNIGITNLVARATIAADELSDAELKSGGERLSAKVHIYRPQVVAVLGISAFRTAFDRPRSVLGRQPSLWDVSELWVLPNPSGLNAHYTPAALAQLFADFRQAIGYR